LHYYIIRKILSKNANSGEAGRKDSPFLKTLAISGEIVILSFELLFFIIFASEEGLVSWDG